MCLIRTTLIAFVLCLMAPAGARADIVLSPLRTVLTAETREGAFTISNPTRRILDGRVSWIDLSATAAGYEPAASEVRAGLSAAPYLSVSPAQFRLKPGERVTVTVKLRDGIAPPPGEKRSHLLIETGAARTLIRKASNGLQADIGAGVSAPVIVRGDGAASATIGETKLLRDSEGRLLLSAAITPHGSHSAYGRLKATFTPKDPRASTSGVLGVRENVAGYLDTEKRIVEIPLDRFSLGEGELTLLYEGAGEYEGRLFDKRSFDIAPPK